MPRASVRLAVLGLSLAAVCVAAVPAHAQGRLDARYVVTLAGIQLGKGNWVIDLGEDQFTAAASGATSGVLQMFASGTGSGASRGAMVGGTPTPASYAASVTADRKTDETRINIISGKVKDFTIQPPIKPNPERVPITDAHRTGVTDPMTGSLVRVPGNGDPVRAEACQRTISVFDGRMRYDLKLTYKRVDRVTAEKGYEGPAVVCAIQFTPISGHVPSRPTIKYLIDRRDMEVWLVPIASTRVLVPFRIVVPTPMGQGVLQATQFVTATQKARAAVTPRTQ